MLSNSSNTPVSLPVKRSQKWTWRRIGLIAAYVGWTFLGFMLAQAIGLAVLSLLKVAGVSFDSVNETVYNTVVNMFIYIMAIAIILGMPYWIKKRKTSLQELGLQRGIRWMDPVWLLAGAGVYLILTVVVTSVAMTLFPSGNYTEEQNVGFSELFYQWEYVLAFISLVLVAPIAEEVIFRGYLFGKLRKYAPIWLAVILSALLFAIAHFQWNVGLDTFALGIVLALLRVVSGSLWPSIMLHMLKNGIAFYFLFVNPFVL